MQRLIRNKYL